MNLDSSHQVAIAEALAPKAKWHDLSPTGREPFPVGWAVSHKADFDQVQRAIVHGDYISARHAQATARHGIIVDLADPTLSKNIQHYRVRYEDGKVSGATAGLLRLELPRWLMVPDRGDKLMHRRTDGMMAAWDAKGKRPWVLWWRHALVRFLDRTGGYRLMCFASAGGAMAAADRICPVAAPAWPGATSDVGRRYGPLCSETVRQFRRDKIATPLNPVAP